MKYTKDQRLDIGRRIYEGEISRFEAATDYDIGSNTAREYMRLYRAEHRLPVLSRMASLDNRLSCPFFPCPSIQFLLTSAQKKHPTKVGCSK